jgi:hypothetical protein
LDFGSLVNEFYRIMGQYALLSEDPRSVGRSQVARLGRSLDVLRLRDSRADVRSVTQTSITITCDSYSIFFALLSDVETCSVPSHMTNTLKTCIELLLSSSQTDYHVGEEAFGLCASRLCAIQQHELTHESYVTSRYGTFVFPCFCTIWY